MKLGRLRQEILPRLQRAYPIERYPHGSVHSEIILSLKALLEQPFYAESSDDYDIAYCDFDSHYMQSSVNELNSSLNRLESNDFLRRALMSWIDNYLNTQTSLYGEDVLDIPFENLIQLDGIAYDADELRACYQERPRAAWCRSPQTNSPYSEDALRKMACHPRLVEYAKELGDYYRNSRYDNPQVLQALYELLCVYYEQGIEANPIALSYSIGNLEVCAMARANFLMFIQTLDQEEQERFFDALVYLNFGEGQSQVNTLRDVFEEKRYYCIKIEQVRLWVFLLAQQPHIGCPWQLKACQEAEGIILPAGAKWTNRTTEEGPAAPRGLGSAWGLYRVSDGEGGREPRRSRRPSSRHNPLGTRDGRRASPAGAEAGSSLFAPAAALQRETHDASEHDGAPRL